MAVPLFEGYSVMYNGGVMEKHTHDKTHPMYPLMLMAYTVYAASVGDVLWMFPISQFGDGAVGFVAVMVLFAFAVIPVGILWSIGRLIGILYWDWIVIVICVTYLGRELLSKMVFPYLS